MFGIHASGYSLLAFYLEYSRDVLNRGIGIHSCAEWHYLTISTSPLGNLVFANSYRCRFMWESLVLASKSDTSGSFGGRQPRKNIIA